MRWWVVRVHEHGDIPALIDAICREGATRCDEVEVFFAEGASVHADLKRSIVGEASESRGWSIGIRTVKDGRIGVSSANDPERWRDCLEAAIASGGLVSPQEWHGLPRPAAIEGTVAVFDPAVTLDVEKARELLDGLLAGASEYPAEITGGSAGFSSGTVVIANSHGLYYEMQKTGVGVTLETIRGTSTGYEFDRSCFLSDIDPVEVGRQAAFYASHGVNGSDVESGSYDIILSPIALVQLLNHVVVPALSGRNVKAGRSFLADKLGEPCMDEALDLHDDPFARGLGSTLWDAEGVPARRLDFVRGGVVEHFAYDLKTAYRYGEESTASAVRGGAAASPSIGVHNLILDGPRSPVDDERAIFAHDLVGAHTANPVTGDFSVELSNPSWVEGGAFAEPIRSVMLAGNIFAMLADIDRIGPESRVVGTSILPPVRFKNLQVIGKY
jgi:PmbA protein